MISQQKTKGFTLIEMILVLAIISTIMVWMLNYITQRGQTLRQDKTVLQMQQILSAGLTYYLNHSYWPTKGASSANPPGATCDTTTWSDLTELQKNNYLPTSLVNNGYGKPYQVNCSNSTNGGGFYIYSTANNNADASIIAGRLPLAYLTKSTSTFPPASCTSGSDCNIIVATVNIPGQNLNNARSVNFAAEYYNGSCVPAPNCPLNMRPSILVMPAAVTGFDASADCSRTDIPCTGAVFPISSFVAYAHGELGTNLPVAPDKLLNCDLSSYVPCLQDQSGTPIPTNTGTLYWRVCLSIATQTGFTPTTPVQGKASGSLIAITRCVPNSGQEQPSGSIDVWQK